MVDMICFWSNFLGTRHKFLVSRCSVGLEGGTGSLKLFRSGRFGVRETKRGLSMRNCCMVTFVHSAFKMANQSGDRPTCVFLIA